MKEVKLAEDGNLEKIPTLFKVWCTGGKGGLVGANFAPDRPKKLAIRINNERTFFFDEKDIAMILDKLQNGGVPLISDPNEQVRLQ